MTHMFYMTHVLYNRSQIGFLVVVFFAFYPNANNSSVSASIITHQAASILLIFPANK